MFKAKGCSKGETLEGRRRSPLGDAGADPAEGFYAEIEALGALTPGGGW